MINAFHNVLLPTFKMKFLEFVLDVMNIVKCA